MRKVKIRIKVLYVSAVVNRGCARGCSRTFCFLFNGLKAQS